MDANQIAELLKARPDLAERFATMVSEPVTENVCTSAVAAAGVVAPLLMNQAYEAIACIAFNRRQQVIKTEILTSGGSDGLAIVDARRIFRWALSQGKSGAVSIILAHNHPSGDVTPSGQDVEVTRRIAAAGKILGIQLLDHIIIGDSSNSPGYTFCSMNDRGIFLGL